MKVFKLLPVAKCRLIIALLLLTVMLMPAKGKFDAKAAKIIDDYIDACGGIAALQKVNTRVSKGSMDFVGTGMKLDMTVYQARPNKSYSIVESAVTGKMESGSDGDIVWENSALRGALIKEGKERAFQLLSNRMDADAHWRDIMESVRYNGEETVKGKPCHKVTLTPKGLHPMINFYDKESKLIVKSIITMENEMGQIKIESFSEDYKKVDGILIAMKARMKMMGQEQVISMQEIKHNVDIPAGTFDIPKVIQELLKKKKEPKKAKDKLPQAPTK